MAFLFLVESATGYALFEASSVDEIGSTQDSVREALEKDVSTFSRSARLVSFRPFAGTEEALSNALQVSEGVLTDELKSFLETNLPKSKKESSVHRRYLGVADPKLGSTIQDALKFPCKSNDILSELIRAARGHFSKIVKGLSVGGTNSKAQEERAQLGLGHAYSRAKVKFNVNRQDNMIIQAIQLLDQMDKDVNTAAMRAKEWYGWHFPELAKIVPDVFQYARLINVIGSKTNLSRSAPDDDDSDDEGTDEDKFEKEWIEKLTNVTLNEDVSKKIVDAGRTSMGFDMSEFDMLNIRQFAERVEALAKYRMELFSYLQGKMQDVAPNLNALLGEAIGARLIAHAGSLTKLSKCPASTVQILGAEKALFRALKSKGNTPKFGLLFNSSYISRAAAKNKGRISRYLANKCAIASRLDAFSEQPTAIYGQRLKDQVEERLEFYETGKVPRKNIDVMLDAKKAVKVEAAIASSDLAGGDKQGKKKKKSKESSDPTTEDKEKKPKEEGQEKRKEKKKRDHEHDKDERENRAVKKTKREEPDDVVEEEDIESEKKQQKKAKKKHKKGRHDDDEQ